MRPPRKLLRTLSTALTACIALTSAPARADDDTPPPADAAEPDAPAADISGAPAPSADAAPSAPSAPAAPAVTNVATPAEPAARPVAEMPLVEDEEDPGAEYQQWAYVSGTAGVALTAGGIMYVAFSDSPGGPLAVVLIGGGLVGLGGAVYLWMLADQERDKAAQDPVTITPVVHDQMIGAALSGTF